MEQNNSALDSTLRYLYNTIRWKKCELMAIEFTYKGTLWRADTAEEAVALRNELEKSDKVFFDAHEALDRANDFWSPDRFMDVITGIGDLQRRFLVAIRKKPGITSKQLLPELGLDSEVALAGVISGLSKKLTQLGIKRGQVFGIGVDWSGKKKTRTFRLDDFFIGAGMEQNWPDAWGDKPKPARKKKMIT
jgi:hypothetical protein